jgi:hypothetical protein
MGNNQEAADGCRSSLSRPFVRISIAPRNRGSLRSSREPNPATRAEIEACDARWQRGTLIMQAADSQFTRRGGIQPK